MGYKKMEVILRSITESDLEDIMRWRMDKEITRYMNTDPQLTYDGQLKWLASVRLNDDVRYWLIEVGGEPAGVISINGILNPNGHVAWAYYIGEKRLRSMKTALSLEMSLYDYVFGVLHKEALDGDIFTLNRGVIQLHLLCGSKIVEEKKNHICKGGIYYDVTFMRMTARNWEELRHIKKYEKIEFPEPERTKKE